MPGKVRSLFSKRTKASFNCSLLYTGIKQFLQRAQQASRTDTLIPSLTLPQCIDYALKNQPALQQAQINVAITKTNNSINVSGWLPQVGVTANLVHYTQLPTTILTTTSGPEALKTGVVNTAIPTLSATQVLFSPNLLYAATSAHLYLEEAKQVVDSSKINVVASVSQAFYNLLLTLAQIDVLKQDTTLFARNVLDAYHQYVGGIVDETDYEQATITLNNAEAQLRQAKRKM